MKILYLTHSLHMGGVEKNLLLLSEVLIKNGHDVSVGARDGLLRSMLEKKGVCFTNYRFNLRSMRSLWKDSMQLLDQIKELRPEIIHSFSAAPSVVLSLSKLIYNINVNFFNKFPFPLAVSSIMGLQNSENEPMFITQARNYLTMLGTKRTFIISPKIDSYVRKLPVSRKRLKKCNVVGVKIPEFEANDCMLRAVRESIGVPENNRIVITIGHLHPRKSHDLFIKMAQIVLKRRSDITFLIVGDGPLEESLASQIQQTDCSGKIRLLGLRNNIYELLSISDICVKPGVVEGFVGITVLEAQIMGIPVVAFDTVDVRLAIEDRETGIICPSSNVSRMADEICSLLTDKIFAKQIAEKGKVSALKSFTIDAVAANLVQAYLDECSATS